MKKEERKVNVIFLKLKQKKAFLKELAVNCRFTKQKKTKKKGGGPSSVRILKRAMIDDDIARKGGHCAIFKATT